MLGGGSKQEAAPKLLLPGKSNGFTGGSSTDAHVLILPAAALAWPCSGELFQPLNPGENTSTRAADCTGEGQHKKGRPAVNFNGTVRTHGAHLKLTKHLFPSFPEMLQFSNGVVGITCVQSLLQKAHIFHLWRGRYSSCEPL